MQKHNTKAQLTHRLITELRELYYFEGQLSAVLRHMAEAAHHDALRKEFNAHQHQTQVHLQRLEDAFALLQVTPQATPTHLVNGLVADVHGVTRTLKHEATLDTALIGTAQKAELLEVAGYRSAILLADLLGLEKVVDLLEVTLEDEISTDKKLRKVADRDGTITDRTHIAHTRASEAGPSN